jgi:hypothetical protein
MAVIESPEAVGVKPFHEFDEAAGTWPRSERLDAIRTAADEFRHRFREQGQVTAVRTVDLITVGYPTKYAFGTAAKSLNPFINITNRLVVVQFHDFEGDLKTLVWEPSVPDGSSEAPFYAQLIERYGEWASENMLSKEYHSIGDALAISGLAPEDVDYVAFDHLHVQDMRILMGTTQPVEGEPEPRRPFFPRAKFLCQRLEVDTLRSVHPLQWAWYVPGGMDHVIEDNLVLLEGDVELGVGVALAATPGHTDGNQSLVINTPDGIWVSSENGVCADNWHPHLSKIPGVKAHAEFMGVEVIMNSNTLEDSLDQYDSMVKEKALADPNRADPRWMNVFPSSEMTSWRRQWPVVPSFTYGGIDYGRVEPTPRDG